MPRRRRVERVLLELRLREGLPLDVLDAPAARRCRSWWRAGWWSCAEDRLVLTQHGRLLADAVVRDLLP